MVLAAGVLLALAVRGDHFSGSSITYDCLGGGLYRVYLDLYLDCNGSDMIPQNLKFTSSCGTHFTLLDLMPVSSSIVSPVCPQMLDQISCNGGTLPGFRYYHFEVQTYLAPCNFWKIYWDICCRNTMVNIQGIPGIYVETTLNNSGGFCDNSPKFTNTGVPYVCVNNPMAYNAAAVDPDGHTLTYALVGARYASPNPLPVTYSPGYSALQPVPGITLDPQSGQISFTATVAGNYTIVLQVSSYRSNGTLIGRVVNDMTFVVPACDDAAPVFQGLTDPINAVVMDLNDMAICADNFCIGLEFEDDDPNANISITTNTYNNITGVSTTVTGQDPTSIALCGTAIDPVFPFDIMIHVTDGACPISNWASLFITANECVMLPVELLSFTSTAEPDGVLLEWSSGSETAMDGYMVQRSPDGIHFEDAVFVSALDQAHTTTDYVVLDVRPYNGENFHRLRMIGTDGTSSTSDIVWCMYSPTGQMELLASPEGWIVQGIPADASWELIDVLGRKLADGRTGPGTSAMTLRPGTNGAHFLLVRKKGNVDHVKLPPLIGGPGY